MSKKLNITIVTGEKIVFRDEADQISIPTQAGVLTILPGHLPLVGIVKIGEIELKKDGVSRHLAISSGILEIRPGSSIVILADQSEFAEEIDLARAEEAYKRAEEAMKDRSNESDVDFARFQSLMDKEINRIGVVRRRSGKV